MQVQLNPVVGLVQRAELAFYLRIPCMELSVAGFCQHTPDLVKLQSIHKKSLARTEAAGDIQALLDHIDYMTQRFGIDHVAIGTDVAYSSRNSRDERKKAAVAGLGGRRREEFRSLWPDDDFVTTPAMADSVAWTNWPLFTVGVVQRGYSDDEIRRIIGGNVLRVLRDSMVDVAV